MCTDPHDAASTVAALTRDTLCAEDFGERIGVSANLRWTPQEIANSLDAMLAARPPGNVWVLGYGSLMWNPLLNFAGVESATLHGWRRSFCLRVEDGRGSPIRPGRMLALEPGGSTQCLAFRLDEAGVREELNLLWTREMVAGAYCPAWMPILLANGLNVTALAFLADPSWHGYECNAGAETVAAVIARATGVLGSNSDYVVRLAAALQAHGMEDDYISAVLRLLRRTSGNAHLDRPGIAR
jgi:cation transport protein ChaC